MATEIKERERVESFFVIEDSVTNTIIRRLYVSEETGREAMLHLEARGQFADWRIVEFKRAGEQAAPGRKLIERAIKMAWKVGSEGGSVESITYEDVISGADYD